MAHGFAIALYVLQQYIHALYLPKQYAPRHTSKMSSIIIMYKSILSCNSNSWIKAVSDYTLQVPCLLALSVCTRAHQL